MKKLGRPGRFWQYWKKTLGADYEQLLRAFFSNFQGQKTFQIYLKNILASAFKNLIAYRWEKIESILFWVEIGYSHTIECVWERGTSMFPVLDTNLVLTISLVRCIWTTKNNKNLIFRIKFSRLLISKYIVGNLN